jgi:MFS family permease
MTLASLSRLLAGTIPPARRGHPSAGGPPPAPVPPIPTGTGAFAALRHRNYRLYWFGQVVSLVGTWMQAVSEPWLVLQLGGSALQLGLVVALEFAPSTLLAPLGGVLADRFDKRKALIWTQVAAAGQALFLFALTVTGVVQIWHVYVLALVLGMINAVNMPVRQAFAAELVPRRELVNAIALNSASFNAARIVGPAIAGITLALWGTAVNFGINAVSYLAVLAGLILMDPVALYRVVTSQRLPVLRSVMEGVRYAVRTPSVLWPLVLLGGVSTFGLNFTTLLPLFARNTLQLDAHGYGALYAVMGVGSLVGSMSLAFLGSRRPLVPLIIGGGVGFVSFELLLGVTRLAPFAFAIVPLIGLSSMLMINTINVTVQYGVPDELRGRVMSLYVLVFAGSSPIGGLFAGGTAQLYGAPAGFVLGALLASTFVVLVAWRLLRHTSMPSLHREADVSPPAGGRPGADPAPADPAAVDIVAAGLAGAGPDSRAVRPD